MDSYEAEVKHLEAEIGRQHLLKEAQAPGSANYEYFQDKINKLTRELRGLHDNIPRLNELNDLIAETDWDLRSAEQDADDAPRAWSKTAAVLGIGGLGFVGASLAGAPGMAVPAIGVMLIIAAVGALFAYTQSRRSRELRVDRARGVLVALRMERDSLLPNGSKE